MFDFKTSLIEIAPLSLMLFPVIQKRMRKSGLFMGAHLCLPPRSSIVSVVFDFKTSQNNCAPVSPM